LGGLHGGDGGVGAGVVADDGGGLAGDGGIKRLGLLGHVVVMLNDQRIVPQFRSFGGGGVGDGLEVRVGMAGRDDNDQGLFLGHRAGGKQGYDHQQSHKQSNDFLHGTSSFMCWSYFQHGTPRAGNL